MARHSRLLILLLVLLTGCASTQKRADDTTTASAERADALGLEADIAEVVFDPRTPVVVKYHASTYEPLAELLGSLVDTLQFPDDDVDDPQELYQQYVAEGLLVGLARALELEVAVEHLDREKPVYLTFGAIAPEQLYETARYGIPWMRPDQARSALISRVVLPSKDPEKLAEALAPLQERISNDSKGLRIEVRTRHVVIHHVNTPPSVSPDSSEAIVERILSAEVMASRLADNTPALRTFARSRLPLTMYADLEGVRRSVIGLGLFESIYSLENMNRRRGQRRYATSLMYSVIQTIALDPSVREFEDYTMTLGADGAGGLVFDSLGTRTKLGVDVSKAANQSVILPSISSRALPEDQTLTALSWSHDVFAAADASGPNLLGEEFATEREYRGRARTVSPARRVVDSVTNLGRMPGVMATFMSSPHFLPNYAVHALLPEQQAFIPLAGRVRIASRPSDDPERNWPIAAAGVVLFHGGDADAREVLRGQLDELARFPFARVQHEVEERDNGRVLVRFAANTELAEAIATETSNARGVQIQIQPERVVELVSTFPDAREAPFDYDALEDVLAETGPLKLTTRHYKHSQFTRLHWGTAPLAEGELTVDGFEPDEPAPECVGRVVLSGSTLISEAYSGHPVTNDELLGPYDDHVDECIEKAPDHAGGLELATARARTMLGWRRAGKVESFVANAEACVGGDQDICKTLERHIDRAPEKHISLAREPNRMLNEACQMGDESGCQLLEELPDTTSEDSAVAKLLDRFNAPARAQTLVSQDMPDGVLWYRAGIEELPRIGPIIHDGVLYIGMGRRVWAMKPDTGEALWSFEVDGGVMPTDVHSSGSPGIEGGPVDTRRAALERHGLLLVRSTGQEPGESHHLLYAIDAKTGEPRWFERVYGSMFSPVLYNDKIFVPAQLDADPAPNVRRLGPTKVVVLDIENGERERTYDLISPAVVSDGLVIGPQNTGGGLAPDVVAALNIDGGKVAWQFPIPADGTDIETLDALDGHVYVSENNMKKLYKLDAETGDVVWEHKVRNSWVDRTAFDADHVYYATTFKADSVRAVSRETGKIAWAFELPDKASLEAGPDVADDRVRVVYHGVGRDGAPIPTWIVELDKTSGEVLTKRRVAARVVTAPLIWNDTLFYHDDNGGFFARELPGKHE